MKRLFGLILTSLLVVGILQAKEGFGDGFGLGVMVGEPTGISLKKWLGDGQAIDAAGAWSFSEEDSFHLHADYLKHNFSLFKPQGLKGQLPLYFGIGGRISKRDGHHRHSHDDADTEIGVRIPLGITYLFEEAPIDLFAEIVPSLGLLPDTDFDLDLALGARFYFW